MNLIKNLFTILELVIVILSIYAFIIKYIKELERKRKLEEEKINDIYNEIIDIIERYVFTAKDCFENEKIIKIKEECFRKRLINCFDLEDYKKLIKEIKFEIERVKIYEFFNKRYNEDSKKYNKKYNNKSIINYFKTLGLNYTEDEKQIKNAYKSLLRKYHPDFNPNNAEALEKTKNINEAYSIIKLALNIK